MAFYAIGDIQGCFDQFIALLEAIHFNPKEDIVWLVGDLVNRGPKSLETLRFVKSYENSIHTVLGNHDLHLLSVAYGFSRQKKGDTLDAILEATDKEELLYWLRQQPLMRKRGNKVLVHAGLLTQWTIDQALSLAGEVSACLSNEDYTILLSQMYGNKPDHYQSDLEGIDRLRVILNVMTRMRFLTKKGKMDFNYKGTIADAPEGLQPWFMAKDRQNLDHTIVFGHWSALGVYFGENVIGTDSGAIWGGPLSAVNLDTLEVIQVNQ
ncbi:symmetrical bis(5'-nucleosyl)-tetraphosphatase [Neisseria sp. Ec49-e6-T10]|uniref:symmetrical bis(5'-nucleosyl)-tetraphosphatase n=1 Tax=Neisseria sp. Ec49-e6-T10 TaxID=3140744 RepID=UPI003EBF9E6E